MKLTIVYHIWKNTEHLEESLKSVFSQNDKDFEFILIDDNATDKVKAIIKRCDFGKLNSFQYVVYSQTLGHSSSYNDGLKIAKGNYAYYMGSNVVLLKDFVKTINKTLEEYPDVDVISFTNESHKTNQYTLFTQITEKAHKITKKSLSNKILSIDFLKHNNIKLDNNHYYPLLYIYAIISHINKWLSLEKELVVFHENKSYTYNLNDIFAMNEYLISKESNSKFWKDNKEFIEYLMIIYVLKIYLVRMSDLYKKDNQIIASSLKKAEQWLRKYIPEWRSNKILLKYDKALVDFQFHTRFSWRKIFTR